MQQQYGVQRFVNPEHEGSRIDELDLFNQNRIQHEDGSERVNAVSKADGLDSLSGPMIASGLCNRWE